uniref:PID domain-containing protein n=3 Tax=Macrostomum lignano TaxID=282301 RepID=A0A1I8IMA7_9PLAT
MAERMSKLWRTLSFRKKRSSSRRHEGGGGGGSGGSRAGASSSSGGKPQHWQDDERKVREGSCSFQVKYLGCMEVYESRGMQVCEEAIKNLMKAKSKHHKRAVLYVNGEALRVVDEITK